VKIDELQSIEAGALLVRIGRLPEPAQQLVRQYIEVLTSDLEARVARMEQKLQAAVAAVAALDARSDVVPGAWPNLSGRYWPVSS
jgi:hypothetical protein